MSARLVPTAYEAVHRAGRPCPRCRLDGDDLVCTGISSVEIAEVVHAGFVASSRYTVLNAGRPS